MTQDTATIEQRMIKGLPVACPTHGILSDPWNMATQDSRGEINGPLLCRACYQELVIPEENK